MQLKSTLPKELESTAQVRFQDCDPFGHLNNARYIDYFMNARQDQLLAHYDFDIFGVGEKLNQNWVVSKSQIAYLLPARLREEVRIRTRLIQATPRQLVVEGLMLDSEGRRLKSVAWVEFTFVNLANGRPARHPQEFMALFEAVLVSGPYGEDVFNGRVRELKMAFRRQTLAQVSPPAVASDFVAS